ncbi:NUDIX domain-containing protein [Terricaulis sp.]|uniref:NUDIX domain-containing protein n=1 Tax=Terricaulis sp. TaxID=2768686 RepID=UPI0037847B25
MQISCGLLQYVRTPSGVVVLLVHPGGPYWRNKDEGAWSIPKGLAENNEDLLAAALREFREETGLTPRPPFLPLESLQQRSGKLVHCWAFEGGADLSAFRSGHFDMEWPRGSGRTASFPEVDRAELFGLDEARRRILPGQRGFLDELARRIGA